jgi:hypothetical protein
MQVSKPDMRTLDRRRTIRKSVSTSQHNQIGESSKPIESLSIDGTASPDEKADRVHDRCEDKRPGSPFDPIFHKLVIGVPDMVVKHIPVITSPYENP